MVHGEIRLVASPAVTNAGWLGVGISTSFGGHCPFQEPHVGFMRRIYVRNSLDFWNIEMPVRRLARDEIGDLGTAIYATKLRPLLEPHSTGQVAFCRQR